MYEKAIQRWENEGGETPAGLHVAETKTSGGIVLPDSATDKPQRGAVVSVGEGHVKNTGKKVTLTVKPGDEVIFSSYAGDEFKIGEETYLLMRESDILAVLG